jgi:hypothetical protein
VRVIADVAQHNRTLIAPVGIGCSLFVAELTGQFNTMAYSQPIETRQEYTSPVALLTLLDRSALPW